MTNANGILSRTFEHRIEDIISDLKTGDYGFLHLEDIQNVMDQDTFLKAAYKNDHIRAIAIELAKAGFYVYRVADRVARFVREDRIPALWHRVLEGDYKSTDDGLIYSYEAPDMQAPARNLVVIFSSMSNEMYGNGLSRYFMQNYKSLRKFLPDDTAILRIADVGGLVGSFYLNTYHEPNNTRRIASLIESTRTSLSLDKGAVITYGASKGGTGALYHAYANGYNCVCVEPVVNDEYYETAYRDSHFTKGGIFNRSKENEFQDLLRDERFDSPQHVEPTHNSIVVVYSDQSPQAPYIEHLFEKNPVQSLTLVNFRHPLISDHPDVSPRSLNLVSMYLNMICYQLPIEKGSRTFTCAGPSIVAA